MNKKTYIIVLPLLVLAVAALAGCIRTVTGLGDQDLTGERDVLSDDHRVDISIVIHTVEGDHVSVDPRLLEELEESEWAEVYYELSMPPGYEFLTGPFDDAFEEAVETTDWELFDQLRAEREADVQAWLGTDLELRMPGYWMTAAGVEKIRIHPFVAFIGPEDMFGLRTEEMVMDSDGTWHLE